MVHNVEYIGIDKIKINHNSAGILNNNLRLENSSNPINVNLSNVSHSEMSKDKEIIRLIEAIDIHDEVSKNNSKSISIEITHPNDKINTIKNIKGK